MTTHTTLNDYQARALQTRTQRAPAAKLARKALAAAIERSRILGEQARKARQVAQAQ